GRGVRAADDGGPGADVPRERRRRAGGGGREGDGRARLRRVGTRQLVLARAAREAPVPGRRAARRPDPLQHGRRGRRLLRRARTAPLVKGTTPSYEFVTAS